MKKRAMIRAVSILAALVMLICCTSVSNVTYSNAYASTLDDLNAKYSDLQNKLEAAVNDYSTNSGLIGNAEARIKSLEEQAAIIDEQVSILNTRLMQLVLDISSIEKSIDEINENISILKMRITDNEREIEEKNVTIEELYKQFESRVRAMYMEGQVTDIQILMTSKSFSDYLSLAGYMSAIASHDDEILDNLTEEINELNVLKSRLEIEKGQLDENQSELIKRREELEVQKAYSEASMRELEQKTEQLEKQKIQSQELIEKLSAQNSEYAAKINSTKSKMDLLEEEIQAEIRAAQARSQEAKREQAQSQDVSTYSGSVTASGFMWPLPGYYGTSYITSYYGIRWGKLHGGIDVSGYLVYGKDIVASKAGTVITAYANHWSFGNFVMIDHGDGYVTLYAHMSSINAYVGQYVQQGQVIGKVGSTGESTGPHLHFELRINGVRINPLPYIL